MPDKKMIRADELTDGTEFWYSGGYVRAENVRMEDGRVHLDIRGSHMIINPSWERFTPDLTLTLKRER